MLDLAEPLSRAAAPADIGTSTILPGLAEGLVFEAGGTRLIDGLDLRLETGPLTVVIGPNGAGKSLLLRLLHGLIRPSAGRLLWAGQAPSKATRQRQAMVFQRPVLLRRSAAANLRYALKAKGLNGAPLGDRALEWLERAGLAPLAGRPARLLSGGEQQRLAVARALSTEPEVLFLDEPTASLDPASALAIEELILEARSTGTKIVLVAHDIGQARRLADEVVFLYRGRVEAQGPADQFFDEPSSDKARAFLAGRIVV